MAASDHHQVPPLAVADTNAAIAALRELPDASIMVFDSDLRFTLVAGHALHDGRDQSVYRVGMPVAHAFPPKLWREIEPLCRSALEGDTRSRKIRATGSVHSLTIDVGPLSVQQHPSPHPPVIAGGVAADGPGNAYIGGYTGSPTFRINTRRLSDHLQWK